MFSSPSMNACFYGSGSTSLDNTGTPINGAAPSHNDKLKDENSFLAEPVPLSTLLSSASQPDSGASNNANELAIGSSKQFSASSAALLGNLFTHEEPSPAPSSSNANASFTTGQSPVRGHHRQISQNGGDSTSFLSAAARPYHRQHQDQNQQQSGRPRHHHHQQFEVRPITPTSEMFLQQAAGISGLFSQNMSAPSASKPTLERVVTFNQSPASPQLQAQDQPWKSTSMPPAPTPSNQGESSTFPPSYQLRGYDIICGRHKAAFNHFGNRRFRVTISIFLDKYLALSSRTERSYLILEIVDTISAAGGHFLKFHKGRWVELDDKEARNKVGHALRDAAKAAKAAENRKTKETKKAPEQPTPEDQFQPAVRRSSRARRSSGCSISLSDALFQ